MTSSYSLSKIVINVLLLFFTITVNAQNLVVNPSFETLNMANLECSWYTTQAQFNNALPGWTCPTGGSTDIFHTSLATSCYCSVNSTHTDSPGQQVPRTGNTYVNVTVFGDGGCDPYREYIQGSLTTPLVVGQSYDVTFYVTLGDNAKYATNNIGVKFFTNALNVSSMCVYSTTPDLNYSGAPITDKLGWTKISFCYTPTVANLNYFVIGNFFSDAATQTTTVTGNKTTIRYFVDDVSITPIQPTPIVSNTNYSICSNVTTVNLYNQLPGTLPTDGTWTGPSVLTGGYLGTFNPVSNTAGSYVYTPTATTGSCGNTTSSATLNITLDPAADATINAINDLCISDASIVLTAAQAGGTWSGNGVTGNTFDPAIAGAGTHVITYSIPGTCPDTKTQTVIVYGAADATINPINPLCVNVGTITLTSVQSGGTWSGNGVVANTFNPAVAGVGNHVITYTITGNCSDVKTLTVSVLAVSDATIQPVADLCSQAPPVTLNAAQPGGTWSGNGVVGNTFNPGTAGVGSHTITYALGGSCPDTKTAIVNVLAVSDATINPVNPLCENANSVTLTSVQSGGSWSGNGIVGNVFNPATAGIGTHVITYSITGFCPDTKNTTITVNAVADATIQPVANLCKDANPVTLTALQVGGTWSGAGVVGNVFNPTIAGVGTHTVTYSIPGVCQDVKTISITVFDAPVFNLEIGPLSGCVPLTVSFKNTIDLPSATSQWMLGDGTIVNNVDSLSHTYTSVGCFDITFISTIQGCVSQTTLNDYVCVEGFPDADFNFTAGNESANFVNYQFTNTSSNANTYTWDFASLGSSNVKDPNFSFQIENTSYLICLEASNDMGCSDTICKVIVSKKPLIYYVPNTFTPDGDNFNQTFQPVFTSGFDPMDYHLMIFDRWGELIFESLDALYGWDGTYNGKICKDGTYSWKIDFKTTASDERIDINGHVNLIR